MVFYKDMKLILLKVILKIYINLYICNLIVYETMRFIHNYKSNYMEYDFINIYNYIVIKNYFKLLLFKK